MEENVGEFPIPPLDKVDDFVKIFQKALKESGLEIVAGGAGALEWAKANCPCEECKAAREASKPQE